MIFPTDSEIRQYASYYIRALGIFKEEFKNAQGRPPNEFEIQDFSKMGIIPFGLLPKAEREVKPINNDPLDEVLKKYENNLHKVNEKRIEIRPRFSDPDVYHLVSKKMFELGWMRAKGEDAFIPREGAKT
ncbi:MAG: hypothetical protein QW393_03405 [Candidatus Micrarchaeaceae archaeon]